MDFFFLFFFKKKNLKRKKKAVLLYVNHFSHAIYRVYQDLINFFLVFLSNILLKISQMFVQILMFFKLK